MRRKETGRAQRASQSYQESRALESVWSWGGTDMALGLESVKYSQKVGIRVSNFVFS